MKGTLYLVTDFCVVLNFKDYVREVEFLYKLYNFLHGLRTKYFCHYAYIPVSIIERLIHFNEWFQLSSHVS